jgi:hypothetical protein
MKKLYILLILVFSFQALNAQLIWQKTYGGSAHEYAWKTIPTSDGGFAFVGFSESNNGDVSGNHGGVDLWVAKADASGTIEWSKLYGGTEDDEGYDITQTADNGFMVVGWTDSFDGDVTGHHGTYGSDLWVLKLTSTGAITWSKCYGGTSDDDGASIAQSQSGDYFVAGSTYSYDGDVSGNHGTYESDFWVIKISSSGTLLNQKCVGGTGYDEGIKMIATADDGCIVVGRTSSTDLTSLGYHGGADMLVAKLTSGLVISWSKCYGGSETEEANAVVQLNDGSYAVLGYSSTGNNGDVTGHHGSQGQDDFWLLKLTSAGAITWAKCFGGDSDDQANGLAKTSDGGFVMSGLTSSTNGDVSGFHGGGFFEPDIWVAKVDGSGTLQGQRCCGGSGQDESFNVYEESSNVFVVTGFTYSSDYDVTQNRGSADGWILKVTPTAGIGENNVESGFMLYPNPAIDEINVNFISTEKVKAILSLKDITGREIISESFELSVGNINRKINISGLAKGIYLIEILNTSAKYSRIFVKQ